MVDVTLKQDEYERLIARSVMLKALGDEGVDKWKGFSKAMERLRDKAAEAITESTVTTPLIGAHTD